MVEAEKHSTQIKMITVPIGPSKFVKADAVKVTPAALSESQTPDTKMRRAVAEQIMRVSIIGPSIATRPSRTGSDVFAAP